MGGLRGDGIPPDSMQVCIHMSIKCFKLNTWVLIGSISTPFSNLAVIVNESRHLKLRLTAASIRSTEHSTVRALAEDSKTIRALAGTLAAADLSRSSALVSVGPTFLRSYIHLQEDASQSVTLLLSLSLSVWLCLSFSVSLSVWL